MLNVEQDLAGLSVVADELVQGVAVRHPPGDARVVRQRNHRVALDRQISLAAEPT